MRTTSSTFRTLTLGVSLYALFMLPGSAAHAATNGSGDPADGSTFARVRYLEGGLSLQSAGRGEVSDATINDAIEPGDNLTTQDGRAEVGLADGSTVWLDRGTRLDVRNLSDLDNRYESSDLLAMEAGAVRIEAVDVDGRSRTFRVDTEAGSIYLLSGGSYRIEVDDGTVSVYSFRGVAELSGDDGSVLVRSGERSSVLPGRAPTEPRRFNTARLDNFDQFCESRQEAYLRRDDEQPQGPAVEEVPDEVHPYMSELSFYGSWYRAPDYGWVWRPVYSAGWGGPYANGYWNWCSTGWVWVSYDPWGWAPYHYGRWDFLADVGWVWMPGRIWGGAWVSFAVGSGHIGWCPLNYYNRPVFQDVSIVNVVNINVNRLQPRGWRFVSVDQFCNPRAPRGGVRVERLPRGTDMVITSKLPRFEPKEVSARPERGARFVETVRQSRAPLPVAVDRDNRPVPFKSTERVPPGPARGRHGAPVPGGAQEPSRPTRIRGEARGESSGPGPHPGAQRQPDGVNRSPRVRPERTPNTMAAPQPRSPETSRERPRPETSPRTYPESRPGSRPGPVERPRTESRQPDRQGGYPDDAIENLFDGVRDQHGRPRVDPPRADPPRVAPPQTMPRSTMRGPSRQARPPQPPPPPQQRPPQKPKEQNNGDKGRGHEEHGHRGN